MEVHHAQHPSHKKKWTGYLLEFFMLFLAVFLGFLAENKREHIIEHKRAKNLALALISDFRKDTAELTRLKTFELNATLEFDSLLVLLRKPFPEIPQQDFYRLVRRGQVSFAFVSSNATINQLKNAGYLRYFSKERLSPLIAEYEFLLKDCEGEDEIVTGLTYDKYYELLFKNLDPILVDQQFSKKQAVPPAMGIASIPPDELKKLQNLVIILRRAREVYVSLYEDLIKKAIEIISYLNE